MVQLFSQLGSAEWTLLLNVALLILATLSAVFALGGDTRRKDREGLLRGLTWRGYATFVCLMLALIVGAGKELLSRNESNAQQAENEQQKGAIGELRLALKDANDTLNITKSQLAAAQLASENVSQAIQGYVYDRLSTHTYSYVGTLAKMIAEASDGWAPSNKQDFFLVEALI